MPQRWWDKKRYQSFLHSSAWKQIRERELERAGRRCEDCSATEYLQVHHLTYARWGGGERPGDLRVLCRSCHRTCHRRPKRAKQPKQPKQPKAKRTRTRGPAPRAVSKKRLRLAEENEQLHQTLAANRERRARQAVFLLQLTQEDQVSDRPVAYSAG